MRHFFISIVALFFFSNANAQYRTCNPSQNPHSYACESWAFQGSLFPLNIIDLNNVIQGEWKTLTYANPWSENDGTEFRMLVSAQNPRIPVGVINKNDNTMLGSLTFDGNKAIWTNWQGKKLKTKFDQYAVTDSYTFRFSFPDGDYYEQSFVCRDFNRNGKHHLICDWYLIRFSDYYHSSYTYEHRGYFGFLKPSDLGSENPTNPMPPSQPYPPVAPVDPTPAPPAQPPSQPSVPVPPTAPPPASVNSSLVYLIQVASFKDFNLADKEINYWVAQGFEVYTEDVQMSDQSTWRRVLIGSFDSLGRAQAAADNIIRTEGRSGLMIKQFDKNDLSN